MSGLPTQIPQQSVPLLQADAEGKIGLQYMNINWYLWAYNISKSVLGTGESNTTPASPYDLLIQNNTTAEGADIPQAYQGLSNLAALIGVTPLLPDPVPAAQPVQTVTASASPFTYTALANGVLSVTGGSVSSVFIIRQGVTVATGITSGNQTVIGEFTDEKGSGGQPGFVAGVDFTPGTTTSLTLSQTYGTAADLWVAFDALEQGANTYTLSGKTLTFNAPIPVGTTDVFVKGASTSTISASGGLVPVRRLDQVRITYTSAPTLVFLPS
jgi:hypothetical protein